MNKHVKRICGDELGPFGVAIAEAIVRVAEDITHECGTEESTDRAVWATILDAVAFLHERVSRVDDWCARGDHACARSVAPDGWYCTRRAGHEGPCAAWPCQKDGER